MLQGDQDCLHRLKTGIALLFSLYDAHCSFFAETEQNKIGYMLRWMYEAAGEDKYDKDWERVTDHMVDMFTCLADGVGEQNPLGMSLLDS